MTDIKSDNVGPYLEFFLVHYGTVRTSDVYGDGSIVVGLTSKTITKSDRNAIEKMVIDNTPSDAALGPVDKVLLYSFSYLGYMTEEEAYGS